MGACFISKALSIKLTPKDIEGWFRAVSVGGGDSEGYSGSWDTLRGVSFPDVPVFDTKEAAREYISDHAGKWSSALCVRYAQRVVRDVFVTVPTIGGVPVVHRGTIVSAVTDWKVLVQPQGFLEVYHPVDQLDPMEKEEAVRLFKAWRGAVKHDTWINSLNHTWRPTLDEQIKARGDIMRTRAEWDAYRRPLEERVWQTRKSRRIEKGWLIGGWAAE